MITSDYREPIEPKTAIRGLSCYVKGLVLDFNSTTGKQVESLNIIYVLEDNKRIVKDVEVITREELPEF